MPRLRDDGTIPCARATEERAHGIGSLTVRFIVTAEWDMDAGNDAARSGKLAETVQSIVEDLEPEAIYFMATHGQRSAVMVVNIDDASELPGIAEPWFLAFNAKIDARPAMVLEDLGKAGPDIQRAVEKYG